MADDVWLHNGNYGEEEGFNGNSDVEDLMECLSFPLTREQFKINCNRILNHISDLETEISRNEEYKDECEALEIKLEDISDLINTRR